MHFLKQWARDLKAKWQGIIRVFPNGYRLSPYGFTTSQGIHRPAKPDANGRLVSLCNARMTSNCPQPPSGDWPANAGGGYWVSMTICRKCPHHIKRRRGQPYPCCAVLRKIAQAGPSPLQQIGRAISAATEKAQEIIR